MATYLDALEMSAFAWFEWNQALHHCPQKSSYRRRRSEPYDRHDPLARRHLAFVLAELRCPSHGLLLPRCGVSFEGLRNFGYLSRLPSLPRQQTYQEGS